MRRAFWQGYSKRVMKEMGYSMSEEAKFVRALAGILEYCKTMFYIYIQLTWISKHTL